MRGQGPLAWPHEGGALGLDRTLLQAQEGARAELRRPFGPQALGQPLAQDGALGGGELLEALEQSLEARAQGSVGRRGAVGRGGATQAAPGGFGVGWAATLARALLQDPGAGRGALGLRESTVAVPVEALDQSRAERAWQGSGSGVLALALGTRVGPGAALLGCRGDGERGKEEAA